MLSFIIFKREREREREREKKKTFHQVVCDHCSANRAPLLYMKNKAARVCHACFEVLQQNYEENTKGLKEDGQHQQLQEDGHRGKEPHNLKAQFRRGLREPSKYRNKKKVPERLMEVSIRTGVLTLMLFFFSIHPCKKCTVL